MNKTMNKTMNKMVEDLVNESLDIPTEYETCLICGIEMDDGTEYQLLCGHTFHYQCLVFDFHLLAKQKRKFLGNQCSLCRRSVDFLPLREPYLNTPIEYAHKEYRRKKIVNKLSKPKKVKKPVQNYKCCGIIGSGVNKGKECHWKTNNKNGYCGKHKNQFQNTVNFFCKSLTQSGKPCKNYKIIGNNYCGIHNKLFSL